MRALIAAALLLTASAGAANDSDRSLAVEPTARGTQAAIRVLRGYAERGDGEGGFAWWMKLKISVRSRLAQSPELLLWRNRVEFLRDANRGDAASCALSGRSVLAHPLLECDYAAELSRYLGCIAPLPPQRRAQLVAALEPDRLDRDAARCGDAASASIKAARTAREAAMK